MPLSDLFLVLVTSATVSGLATFILKMYYQHLLDRKLQIETEKIKSTFAAQAERLKIALDIQRDEQKELARKRLEVYSEIVELAYRIKNLARDTSSDVIDANKTSADSFATNVLELENTLFKNRLFFDTEGSTKEIHDFKNGAISYNVVLGDIAHFKANDDEKGVKAKKRKAAAIYRNIDDLFVDLHRKIMAVTSSPNPLLHTKV